MVDNPDKIELGQAVQLQSSEYYENMHHEMCIKRDKHKTLEDKNINLSLKRNMPRPIAAALHCIIPVEK